MYLSVSCESRVSVLRSLMIEWLTDCVIDTLKACGYFFADSFGFWLGITVSGRRCPGGLCPGLFVDLHGISLRGEFEDLTGLSVRVYLEVSWGVIGGHT